ncbi:MAG: hypothetical protein WAV92_09595 [Halopseudomonas yangmingensis]
MADDVRLIARHEAAEPFLAIVCGKHVYRRHNETLGQFVARAEIEAARYREAPWYGRTSHD